MNLGHAIDEVTASTNGFRTTSVVRRSVLALLLAFPLVATAVEQKTFATPEQAVDALMAALKADDEAELLAIFGEQHKNLVVTSDRAANSATRAEVLAHMKDFHDLQEVAPDRRTLLIGDQAWPVPIPLVRNGSSWRFATEEGEQEIFNRRIGRNERNAITVLHAYLDAQRQYASHDRESAAGGAYSYVINGRMIAGFAMVAYPDVYGESGVMTFIVNHNGTIFEKDLGRNSTAQGARMKTFDPGAGWTRVAP
jgi:hypothetical protein